jgi:lysophospholipase L1-like esterase
MRKLVLSIFFVSALASGQDALRFANEVDAIQKKYDTLWDASKETIVFTGSSSIRMWQNLQDRFPKHQIINSGFGGSQASDLMYYINELVLDFKPKRVFIYEGDNDLAGGKKSKEIINDINTIVAKIRALNPTTEIVLIAAKPSIARWNLKRKYKQLNRRFKKMSASNPQLSYADVWQPMLTKRRVKQDIFIEDGLHMNAKGYELWYEVIKEHIDK